MRRGSRPATSMRSRRASAAPPGGRSRPDASSSPAPNACIAPAPPSTVALPPTPTMMRAQPRSSAARMRSPVPYVVATSGSRSSGRSSTRPDAAAISIAAARSPGVAPGPSRIAHEARTGRISGSCASVSDTLTATRREHRIDEAGAAVGHRRLDDLCVGQRRADAGRDGACGLGGGQAALELLRRDDDAHAVATFNLDRLGRQLAAEQRR